MQKYLIFIVIALVSAVLVYSLDRADLALLRNVDFKMKDVRMVLRGPLEPPASVIIVAIDNKSIKEIGRWPWSREKIGELIRGMAEYGVTVAALDFVFSEPQTPASDAALAESIALSGNVIAGHFFRDEVHVTDPDILAQIQSSRVTNLQIDKGVSSVPLIQYAGFDANLAGIGQGALAYGFFNVIADSDGLFRQLPLLMLYDGNVYPAMVLQALAQYTRQAVEVHVGKNGVRNIKLGSTIIPCSSEAELTANFYGKGGSIKTYSAADIMSKRLPANELQGKLAFAGFTEMGIYDVRPTPFDSILPGVEIHATIAANTLEKRFILHNAATIQIEHIILVTLPLLLALILAVAPSTTIGFTVGGIASGIYLLINYICFTVYQIDLSMLFPVVAIALTTVGSEIYRSLVVDRKGRYMKKAFSNYVSADLVAQILKNPDSLKLGGEKREISILFSDIRGFTTLSEQLTPEELVQVLNEYLNPMTRIVLEEKGTLDKYIGDAVMAIYNAPLDVAGHADHACCSALKMMAKLVDLNRSFSERGLHTIDIGIGINTGDAVVGNMGADMRFDYTAIGDNVNLASRLEGLNKMYGTHIIVSETTRNQTTAGFLFRELDLVAVKGKQKPVAIYELVAEDEETKIADFSRALALYRQREFASALAAFEHLSATQQDAVALLYCHRCREFMLDPPGDEWDGVFVAKSK